MTDDEPMNGHTMAAEPVLHATVIFNNVPSDFFYRDKHQK